MKAKLKLPHNDETVSKLYSPTERHISEDANICLNCDQPTCKGECQHYKKQKQKLLKELQ